MQPTPAKKTSTNVDSPSHRAGTAPPAGGLQGGERALEFRGDLGSVRGAGEQHDLGVRVELGSGAHEVDEALLEGAQRRLTEIGKLPAFGLG